MIKNIFRKKEKVEKKKLPIKLMIGVALITMVGIAAGSITTYFLMEKEIALDNCLEEAKIPEINEAYQYIIDDYYEEVDKDELIDAAIKGMTSILDTHSSYMDPEETTLFNELMTGSYRGVGIEFNKIDGQHTVLGIIAKSPASKADLRVGDIIYKLDGVDYSDKTTTELSSYIKTNPKTDVLITIKRNNEEKEIKVTKAIVVLPSIESEVLKSGTKKIGYLKISVFADNTSDQFEEELLKLEKEKISGLIIDVRGNGGGYLHAANKMMELFLQPGKIIYEMQTQKDVDLYKAFSNKKRSYPIVVLVNGASASASEIIAAALKESYGAILVGTKTYGKGTVQQAKVMSNGGLIKITTNKWLTPSGFCVEGVGYNPDINVELSEEYYKNPIPKNDNQLQRALEELK